MASGQQVKPAACKYCGRDFCDRQASADDLAECYSIAYIRIETALLAAGQLTEWVQARIQALEKALQILRDEEAGGAL